MRLEGHVERDVGIEILEEGQRAGLFVSHGNRKLS
jgi:hypothetical protein